jgi:hypothetical protein
MPKVMRRLAALPKIPGYTDGEAVEMASSVMATMS